MLVLLASCALGLSTSHEDAASRHLASRDLEEPDGTATLASYRTWREEARDGGAAIFADLSARVDGTCSSTVQCLNALQEAGYADPSPNSVWPHAHDLLGNVDNGSARYEGMRQQVAAFARELGRFVGAKYTIATNSGTSALSLCMRYAAHLAGGTTTEVHVPDRTYYSVPIAVASAGFPVALVHKNWSGQFVMRTPKVDVVDSAWLLAPGMYQRRPGSLMIISMGTSKPFGLGDGGAVFTDRCVKCGTRRRANTSRWCRVAPSPRRARPRTVHASVHACARGLTASRLTSGCTPRAARTCRGSSTRAKSTSAKRTRSRSTRWTHESSRRTATDSSSASWAVIARRPRRAITAGWA